MGERTVTEVDIEAFLRRVSMFAPLSDGHIRELSRQVTVREVSRGEMVTIQGEQAEALYIVVVGRFKRFKVSPDGREQILKFLQAGESFGEVPLLDGGPEPAGTQAMEPGTLCILPGPRFEALLRDTPDVALGLVRVLAERVRHLTGLVEDLSFRHRTDHVAKLVLERAGSGDLDRLTQSDMAAATGTAREVVGRALRELQNRGAIRLDRGRISICDRSLLESIVRVADD